jgi:hypothetical protein
VATPTDQRDRARHPEDFARPDDRMADVMRTWTGIGAPANKYDWGHNPTHGQQSEPGTPVGRPLEKLVRPPEITEYVPPFQKQRDPWSLTESQQAQAIDIEPLIPTAPAPVSTNPIVEFTPLRQRQKDPWELTRVQKLDTVERTPVLLRDVDVSDVPIVEYVPDPQQQREPWSLTVARLLKEADANSSVVRDVKVSHVPIVEYTPARQVQKDPWSLTKPSVGASSTGQTAINVPKTQ